MKVRELNCRSGREKRSYLLLHVEGSVGERFRGMNKNKEFEFFFEDMCFE